MNPWYSGLCALVFVNSAAYAVDHHLLTNFGEHGQADSQRATQDKPAAGPRQASSADSSIQLAQQVRRRPATPDPDLHDGERWLCSVGQPPEINVQAFRRARAKGWGFWSFAEHAGCPAGVYLTVASGGALKNTGESVWTDEPKPGETLANYTAMPNSTRAPSTIPTARTLEHWQRQPVSYALSAAPGSDFGFGESNVSCAACSGAAGLSSGVMVDYGHAAWHYAGAGGSSLAGSSGSSCASCSGR